MLFELFYIKNDFAKYFAKCCNLFIYIFCFAYYCNSLKRYISILQEKSNILELHNFTKCFSGTRVNQILDKYFNGYLSCLLNLLFFAQ